MNDSQNDAEITVSGHENINDALGLLKDWATTLVGFATLALGALAGFIEIKSEHRLFVSQKYLLIGCLILLTAALVCAGFLLYMLPGAAQRKHRDSRRDIYSLRTYGQLTIGFWAGALWTCFLVAVVLFASFVGHRVIHGAPCETAETENEAADTVAGQAVPSCVDWNIETNELAQMSPRELRQLHGQVIEELRLCEVLRTQNNPVELKSIRQLRLSFLRGSVATRADRCPTSCTATM